VVGVGERGPRQKLDRHRAFRTARLVDLAHRAAPEHLAEQVLTDLLVGEPSTPGAQRPVELLARLDQQRLAMHRHQHLALKLADRERLRAPRHPRSEHRRAEHELDQPLDDQLLLEVEVAGCRA